MQVSQASPKGSKRRHVGNLDLSGLREANAGTWGAWIYHGFGKHTQARGEPGFITAHGDLWTLRQATPAPGPAMTRPAGGPHRRPPLPRPSPTWLPGRCRLCVSGQEQHGACPVMLTPPGTSASATCRFWFESCGSEKPMNRVEK